MGILAAEARAALAQLIDARRGLRLGQSFLEGLTDFLGEGSQVGALGIGYRLVAGLPFVGIALQLFGHWALPCRSDAHRTREEATCPVGTAASVAVGPRRGPGDVRR